MSYHTKKQNRELLHQEMLEEEQQKNKLKVRALLLMGFLGFTGGFLAVIISNLSDNRDILWTAAFVIGTFTAGIPFGWVLVGDFFSSFVHIYNIPALLISFLFKGVLTVFVGWIAYPIALLLALIKANAHRSKLQLLFKILLVLFIFGLALFFAITSL